MPPARRCASARRIVGTQIVTAFIGYGSAAMLPSRSVDTVKDVKTITALTKE